MKYFSSLCIILLTYFESSLCNLSKNHGFLYPPKKIDGIKLHEDQWFDQFLDHSDPTSNITWKQVNYCYILFIFVYF